MKRIALLVVAGVLALVALGSAQDYYRGSSGGTVLAIDGTSGAPAYGFASEPTLGFWRSGAGSVTLQGTFIASSGIQATNTIFTASGALIGWASRTLLGSPSDGSLVVKNNAQTIGSQFKADALPSVVPASCGAGSPAVTAGSTPLSGSVAVGTGSPASCQINFNGTNFPANPNCSGSVVTTTAANVRYHGYSGSASMLTITPNAAWVDGSVVNWNACISSK